MDKEISPTDINLLITDSAVRQIQLMQENDYTLKGLEFRIKIGGKGCGGFTYEAGFSEKHDGDLEIIKSYPLINITLKILMDPFTAFYTKEATLDYLLDADSNEEGFILTNAKESEHRGKFYKDTSKLPPWAKA